jgi:hypothetical protein
MVAAVILGLSAHLCAAAPPPTGSEQETILAPHAAWVKGLMNPYTQQGCCDLSDCRVVSARVRAGHYQAFIGRDAYGHDAPNEWLDVPEEVVLHERTNPVGLPIACWRAARQPLFNGFFCFQDGSAT